MTSYKYKIVMSTIRWRGLVKCPRFNLIAEAKETRNSHKISPRQRSELYNQSLKEYYHYLEVLMVNEATLLTELNRQKYYDFPYRIHTSV